MATTLTNKTMRPLSVPLSRGKKLRLGAGKSGEIAAADAERPAVQKLIEDGTVEISRERNQGGASGAVGSKGRPSSSGHGSGGGARRSGDR